jgi:hypothetical protein
MERFAKEYVDDAHFVFVYVREAHPDDFPDLGHHSSFEQKMEHARALREKFDSVRTFVVDDLEGSVHRQYAGLPNMSFVIDHTGRTFFKGEWTLEEDLRPALENALKVREMKRMGGAPYYTEAISYTRFERGGIAQQRRDAAGSTETRIGNAWGEVNEAQRGAGAPVN